ncbi:MFS transporter [Acidiferrimicrobium sp. IK]|uniref:MFS transporter n=1 Tax=Acidiferrimicrobium sp. IK TaxID=2871700 RepID=UPI0021CAFCEE|nr:MFS transporter [Acidiferrimicrobium sp. IK]MCU4183247.1 MFS transporter [Acidiferrimicrobium sp. IK]
MIRSGPTEALTATGSGLPLVLRNADDVVRAVDTANAAADPAQRRRAARQTLLVMMIALGGVFVDAYDFSSMSIGTVQLKHVFHLTSTQVGEVSAAMAASALFGALIGGYFVDKLGRRRMFSLDLWLLVVAAIGASLAPNLPTLVAFRLLMGIGVGLDFPVALCFVAEFSDKARRGRFVNSSYANWYLAAILGYGAGWVGYELGAGGSLWRMAVGFGAVPAAVLLFLRYRYMLESPLWAAHQGDLNEAARILRRTRNLEVEVDPVAAQTVAATVRARPDAKATVKILFSRRYRSRATLSAVLGFAQSIEYYAVVFYLPVISQVIFGQSLLKALLGGAIFSAVGLVGSSVQAWICDRTGIRPLALLGSVLAAIGLIGIGVGHAAHSGLSEALMVGLFMLGHTVGPGPQCMAYGTLSFPTVIRGSSVGWTQGMLRIGSVIGFLIFPILQSALGFSATFATLAACPLVILVAVLLIPWEPIGVDVESEWADQHIDLNLADPSSRLIPAALPT